MSVDWNSVFQPTIGVFEIVVRGTIMYLALFAILRLVSRRQAGSFGPADLLVIVLIADAALWARTMVPLRKASLWC